ncbi:SHOCT domain-containing protein [Haladaptatus sp. AB618]|uniref:SHOCT domain-containing protein n=1 Tax=Haladaptatus sp. AB618 TaxID=2934173 RepID=UPI00209C4764|nr:SHOCT domain-containing protein [Haladaptatus sp. AB618]MCO8255790.1 SHOCT domain-containing protein [Haladaptatus sp. AB618]
MTLARRLETRTATLATLATTLLATTTGTVVAHTNGAIGGAHSWGGHMWGDGWMAGPEWMGLWGLLWMGVFIAIPLALVYLATRRETERKTDSAAAVLRERYARGEIDDDEFERLRAKLS